MSPVTDDVILFVALAAGLRPISAPVCPWTGNIDAAAIPERTWRTVTGVLTSNLYGVPDPVVELRARCDRFGVTLIEDACHAIDTTVEGRPIGTFGTVGAYSLSKHAGATAGGFLAIEEARDLPSLERLRDQLTTDAARRRDIVTVATSGMENGERPLRPADGHLDAATTDDLRPTMSVGLFADPGFPVDVACAIAEGLPGVLEHQVGDRWAWTVRWHGRRLVADEQGAVRLPAIVRDMARHGHDLVVCLTDQPRRAGFDPSWPRRACERAWRSRPCRRWGSCTCATGPPTRWPGSSASWWGPMTLREGTAVPVEATSTPGRPLLRLDRVVPGDDAADVRFLGTGRRSRLRLLAGMVLANRPWRLVPRLTAPFAAALATAAFVLVNTTVWQMADHLSPLRLTTATVAAVAAMVAWLIVDHRMWERPDAPPARRLAVLYNTATTLSLALGRERRGRAGGGLRHPPARAARGDGPQRRRRRERRVRSRPWPGHHPADAGRRPTR